jgi:hypothetical protein
MALTSAHTTSNAADTVHTAAAAAAAAAATTETTSSSQGNLDSNTATLWRQANSWQASRPGVNIHDLPWALAGCNACLVFDGALQHKQNQAAQIFGAVGAAQLLAIACKSTW